MIVAKRTNKIISWLICFAMVITILPISVFADETVDISGETTVTMQKDVAYFGNGYYELTPPNDVTFTNIEWSVSGELPEGITLGVNRADGDGSSRAFFTGTPTAMTDGAISVTVSAEATDGNNTYTGTLTVSITVEDSPAHLKLDELIQSADCVVDMEKANTEEAVVEWIQNTWLPSLDGYTELVEQLENDWTITVEAVSEQEEGIGGFTAAVAGTEDKPDGTDGSLIVRFRLDENYNYLDSTKTCTIKAAAYIVSPDTDTYKVTFYPNTTEAEGRMQQQTFTVGVEQALSPNAFTYTGYIFMGWNTQMDGEGTHYSNEASITLTDNLILYAQWMELTITAEQTSLTGNGTINFTTSFGVDKITCSESKYERYISGWGQDWTFQMKNNVTTELTFTITYRGETASCTVTFVQDPNALILTTSQISLTGNGVIALTGNKEITGIKCSNMSYDTDISGAGRNWQFVMDRNVDVYLYFEATDADGKTALCWVDFNEFTLLPFPMDTEQNENGEIETTVEPSTVIKEDTATGTITVTDGNAIVDVLVANRSDRLVIAPNIEEDVSKVEVSIPDTVVNQLAERTDAGLTVNTPFADVSLSDKDFDKYKGSLDMEATKTDTGYSAKVSVGGVSVLDTSVMLFVSLDNLPEDGKLEVGTLQPSGDDLDFVLGIDADTEYLDADNVKIQIVGGEDYTAPDGTEYRMHEIIIINGEEYLITNYMGVGDVLVLMRLSDGATGNYNVAVNKLDFTGSMNGTVQEYAYDKINIGGITYDVRLSYNSDAGRVIVLYYNGSPAGKMYIKEYRSSYFREGFDPETLKAQQSANDLGTVTPGENPIDGLVSGKTYNVSVVGSNDIHLEGAENIGGTVTQTFDIPAEFIGNENVKYAVVHITNPHATALAAAKYKMEEARADYWEYHGDSSEERQRLYEAANRASMEWAIVQEHYDAWEREHAADSGTGNELGTVTIAEDGKTLTATYEVDSFSPFTVYAFVEADESDIKEITLPTSRPSSSGGGVSRYTVKFDTNGGSKIANKTVTRNSKLAEPEAPTKDGYTFNGWYTDEELTEKYDFDSKVTKGFTLYAKWDKHDDETPVTDEWENPFEDVKESDWFFEDVKYANQNELMNGVSETEFAPNDKLTRAMLVTVLYRLEGEPATNKSIPFADVDMGAYYGSAVSWAKQNGIVNGVTENEFAPNDNITREQIAAIMHRYAQYKGYDVSVGENTNILSYDDFDTISEYAISSMQYACGSGLIKGKLESTLNPLDNATRAEIAAILHRFIEANK